MSSKNIQILIPGVSLHSKKVLAGVVKLRIWRWGDYFGFSGWVLNVITGVSVRGSSDDRRGEGSVTVEAGFKCSPKVSMLTAT